MTFLAHALERAGMKKSAQPKTAKQGLKNGGGPENEAQQEGGECLARISPLLRGLTAANGAGVLSWTPEALGPVTAGPPLLGQSPYSGRKAFDSNPISERRPIEGTSRKAENI